jgi:hypothetical protein
VALHGVTEGDDRRAQGLGPELLHFGHSSRLLNLIHPQLTMLEKVQIMGHLSPALVES